VNLQLSNPVTGPDHRRVQAVTIGPGASWPGSTLEYDPHTRAYLIRVDGKVVRAIHGVGSVEVI